MKELLTTKVEKYGDKYSGLWYKVYLKDKEDNEYTTYVYPINIFENEITREEFKNCAYGMTQY